MIKRIIKIVLRVLAILVTGVICAVLGFIVVVNLGFVLAPDFTYNGWEGYEATGPIGFILGALVGLIGSSLLLFRKATRK